MTPTNVHILTGHKSLQQLVLQETNRNIIQYLMVNAIKCPNREDNFYYEYQLLM